MLMLASLFRIPLGLTIQRFNATPDSIIYKFFTSKHLLIPFTFMEYTAKCLATWIHQPGSLHLIGPIGVPYMWSLVHCRSHLLDPKSLRDCHNRQFLDSLHSFTSPSPSALIMHS